MIESSLMISLVSALGQLDHKQILAAFGGIILVQARAKPGHFATNRRIELGIIARAPAAYLGRPSNEVTVAMQ